MGHNPDSKHTGTSRGFEKYMRPLPQAIPEQIDADDRAAGLTANRYPSDMGGPYDYRGAMRHWRESGGPRPPDPLPERKADTIWPT